MAPTKTTDSGIRGATVNRQGTSGRSNNFNQRRNYREQQTGGNEQRYYNQHSDSHNNNSGRQPSRDGEDGNCQAEDSSTKNYPKGRSNGGRSGGAIRKAHNKHYDTNRNQQTPKEEHTQRDRVYSECSDEHCPVCLNRMSVYAVGMCNHPVCGECCTRMRILCN